MQPLLTQRQASEMLALSERWPEVRALWSEFVDLRSKQILVEDEVIPDDIPLMELADKVVRGKVKLAQQQLRMLIEMLPYIAPKLSATAIATMDGKTFAEALDRAIERSKSGGATSAEVLKKPMSRLRRF
jgi:hypothetical protein